jgi:hypothetical protein
MITSRPTSFVIAISLSGALSFAAGRLVPKRSEAAMPAPTSEAAKDNRANELPAPVPVPDHLPEVAKMPFREAYLILKSAPEETLRSYFYELQQKRPKPVRYAAMVSFFKTLIHVNSHLTSEMILQLKRDDRWPAMAAIRDASPPGGMHAVAEVLLAFDRAEISSCSWDMLADTLDEWGRNDPSALKEFLESHRDRDVDRYFPALVRNWAAYHPEAAQQWMSEMVQKHPPQPPRDDGLIDEWSSTASTMAIAWLEGFLENDPEAAVNYVLGHATQPGVSAAIESFSGDLFMMSPDRVRDFLNRLPEAQRSAGLGGISNKADRFVRSEERDKTASPRFIAEWMMKSFPNEWEQPINYVLVEWKYGNAQELFAWMADLPPDLRRAVFRHFETYVSDDRPNEDFDFIMQAPNPVVRDGLLETLARNATSHGKALLGVIENSNLPASQKAYLASLIPPDKSVTAVNDSDGN